MVVRGRSRQKVGDERILGGQAFVATVLREAQELIRLQMAVRRNQSGASEAIERVCRQASVSARELQADSLRKPVSKIRAFLAQRLVAEFGLPLADVARHGSTIRGLRNREELTESPNQVIPLIQQRPLLTILIQQRPLLTIAIIVAILGVGLALSRAITSIRQEVTALRRHVRADIATHNSRIDTLDARFTSPIDSLYQAHFSHKDPTARADLKSGPGAVLEVSEIRADCILYQSLERNACSFPKTLFWTSPAARVPDGKMVHTSHC